ncbi:L-serine ammonia-lyase, iron-sulfur-dependent subunit beta [bacterium]|uniref:L-serine dehydratase n=1 Tax=Candidatus Scatenecus faecavium TaxID=2840915 RepID=A0A9D1FWS8_9BACT|nr:L-serine ammonia-lyase, iron-sulfur-dependent subunit beta [bacterium]HIS83164.1 L-serine ammonia-lyase, iron-sulfur-dependent, subunit beta [Candidatus Scatenecus faecavium]
MKQTSIIDIISPVMVGPSSSHTAGAVRLGLLAKNIYNEIPDKVVFKLYNSYAQTGKGHGTDKGLLAGVLGLSVDDVQIKDIFDSEISKEFQYEFQFYEDFNRHPNAVDIIFEGRRNMVISGNSVGAGEVEITNIDGFSVSLTGKYNTLLLVYKDVPNMISRVTNSIHVNIASFHCDRSAKGQEASMTICLDGEINQKVVDFLNLIEDVYMIRYIKKLES